MTSDGACDDGVHSRHKMPTSSDRSTPSASADYTADQKDKVDRIKKASSHYEMLGVTKFASEDDIKKSYKKLALQVHPDKNRAPGATEAFKDLGNAVSVLTDSERRRQYDLGGGTGNSQPTYTRHYRRQDYNTEVSPEDIFNMFFKNQSFTYQTFNERPRTSSRRHTFQSSRSGERQTSSDGLGMLFQLAPLIIMFSLSLLSFALQAEDPYRFSRSEKYSHSLQTSNLGVKYFVKDGFKKVYYGNILRKLEREIENVYVTNLRQECYREQLQRENMRWRARYNNDGKAYENASSMKLPNCDKLEGLYA